MIYLDAQWHRRPSLRVSQEILAGDDLREDQDHVAEPGRRTEPPFALRTYALEFWIFQESGLGGR